MAIDDPTYRGLSPLDKLCFKKQAVSEGGGDADADGVRNDVNYVSWFDVVIEGENTRGRLEFGPVWGDS